MLTLLERRVHAPALAHRHRKYKLIIGMFVMIGIGSLFLRKIVNFRY